MSISSIITRGFKNASAYLITRGYALTFVARGSRDINPATAIAAEAVTIQPVLFVKMEFDDGDVNMHTQLGNITFGGDTYTGVGRFAGIGTADEVSDLSTTSISLTLSGLPNDLISILFNQQYQGRLATVYLGYLDLITCVLVDTPTILYRGIIDTADFAQADTFSISLSVGNRFAAWNNPNTRRYNNADQQQRFPFDKGLEFIEQTTNKTVIWGAAQ
jgi:hypothetical protein